MNSFLQGAAHENILVRASKPNRAAGDCIFESTADQFLFEVRGRHFPGRVVFSHQDLREQTVEALSSSPQAREHAPVDSDLEWQSELGDLFQLGVWDTKVSDLVLPGIAFTLKKNILIFYTNPRLSDHPITVYTPGFLHGEADCDVPLVYCYDGSHYEGLIPETIEDEQKCSRLVDLWLREEYMTNVQDIPVLWNQLSEEVSRMFMKHFTDNTR